MERARARLLREREKSWLKTLYTIHLDFYRYQVTGIFGEQCHILHTVNLALVFLIRRIYNQGAKIEIPKLQIFSQ